MCCGGLFLCLVFVFVLFCAKVPRTFANYCIASLTSKSILDRQCLVLDRLQRKKNTMTATIVMMSAAWIKKKVFVVAGPVFSSIQVFAIIVSLSFTVQEIRWPTTPRARSAAAEKKIGLVGPLYWSFRPPWVFSLCLRAGHTPPLHFVLNFHFQPSDWTSRWRAYTDYASLLRNCFAKPRSTERTLCVDCFTCFTQT